MTYLMFKVNELLFIACILLSSCFITNLSVKVTSENVDSYFNSQDHEKLNLKQDAQYDIDSFSGDAFKNYVKEYLYIYIDRCFKLSTLPENLFQVKALRKVKYVYMRHNEIEYLPENLFHGLLNIIIILVENNLLQRIPPLLFQSNTNLEKISLYENKLTSLPAGIFANNPKLKVVDLRGNQLKSLPKRMFPNNKILTEVDLRRNKMVYIDPDTFSDENIKRGILRFSYNNLVCLPESFLSYKEVTYYDWLTENCLNESSQICQKFKCESRQDKVCEEAKTSTNINKCQIKTVKDSAVDKTNMNANTGNDNKMNLNAGNEKKTNMNTGNDNKMNVGLISFTYIIALRYIRI